MLYKFYIVYLLLRTLIVYCKCLFDGLKIYFHIRCSFISQTKGSYNFENVVETTESAKMQCIARCKSIFSATSARGRDDRRGKYPGDPERL